MTPKNITTLIIEAEEDFPFIQSKPNGNNITCIQENRLSILLEIPHDGAAGMHNLVGIIQNTDK